ncbi:type VI secretion system-associated FHA domain protein [Collimonas sp.]|uniref:type VI secretion system-associated FHA domain protein n=1 Tax=Collimonas sp. TaxID=1963772 RepID=UPI0037C123D8
MIKINVVSSNSVAPAPPLSAVFGREPKTLGRSEENHFILPDFRNYVSRTQAAVKSDGVQHKITNLSRANPILLNGHEINPECECDLQTGDEIQIGLYLLRAEAQPNLMKDSPDMSSQREHAAINPNQFTDIPEALPSVSENRKAAATQPNLELVAGTGSTASTPLQGLAAEEKPSAAADPARHADNHALILAFMKGAGLPAGALAPVLTPEMMETVGRLLATAVQGTIDLNASRALVKREAHADVTKVVVRNNNPLKFFTDSQDRTDPDATQENAGLHGR